MIVKLLGRRLCCPCKGLALGPAPGHGLGPGPGPSKALGPGPAGPRSQQGPVPAVQRRAPLHQGHRPGRLPAREDQELLHRGARGPRQVHPRRQGARAGRRHRHRRRQQAGARLAAGGAGAGDHGEGPVGLGAVAPPRRAVPPQPDRHAGARGLQLRGARASCCWWTPTRGCRPRPSPTSSSPSRRT